MNNKIHQKFHEPGAFFGFNKKRRELFLRAVASATLALIGSAKAAPIHANGSLNDLTTAAAWVENVVPGTSDIAIWDGTNAVGGNLIGTAPGNLDFGGIQIFNPPGDVTILETSPATLKIEGSGIDMSAATADLTISNWVNFTVNADQIWNVPSGRVLSVPSLSGGTFSIANHTLNITGGGVVQLGISNSPTASGASVNPSISTGGVNVQAGATFAMNANALPNGVNGAGTVVLNGNRPDQSSVSSSANYTTAGMLKLNWASNTRINPASGNWSVGALYISDTNQIFTQGGTTIIATGAGGLTSYFGGVGYDDKDGAGGPPYMGAGYRGLIRNGGTVTINSPVMLLNDGLAPDGVTRLGVLIIGNGTATFNGVIDDGNPGNGGYGIGKPNNASGANITFTAANTYHGDTRWNNGTLTLKNANALQNSTLNNTGGTIVFDSSVSGNIFTFGGLSGNAGLSLQNNAGSPAGIILNVGNNGNNTTYDGSLQGAGSLTKIGNGTLTLTSGGSSYNGNTTVQRGILNINSDGNLGTVPTSPTPGNLVINGGTLQTASAVALSANRGIAFGPATGTGNGTIDVSGQADSYSGIAANNGGGTGGLVLIDSVGGGSLTLDGANTYSGSTVISNVSLVLAAGGSLTSSMNIQAGGTFDVTAFGTYAMTGSSVTSSGTVTAAKIAGGTVDFGSLPVILNYDGSDPALTISSGTLSLHGNSFTINGSTLSPGTYTVMTQTSGTISDSGSHVVSGTALAGNIGAISVSGGNVVLTVTAGVSFSAFKVTGGSSLAAGGSESVTVQAVNSSGTVVTGVNGLMSVTFSGLGTSGNGTVPTIGGANQGTSVSLNFVSGAATATLTVSKAESATLQITDGIHSSTGTGGSGLALTVSGGAAAGLSLTTSPSATATAGVPLATQPVVRIVDSYGNAASSSAIVSATASAGTVQGSASVGAVAGVATFSGLYLTNTGPVTLTFSSTGLGSTNSVVTVSPGVAANLAIATQPSSTAVAGTTFAQQPAISILDAYGNETTANGVDVTATPSTGTLSGTPTEVSSLGTASYSDLFLTTAGNATLIFSASGFTSVTSSVISVSGGTATTLVWSRQPAGAASGVPFTTQPILQTADTYGNLTTNGLAATLNVAVTLSGSGTLIGTTNYNIGSSGSNGVVNFSNLGVIGSGTFNLSAFIIPDSTIGAPSNTIASFASNCILWLDGADTNTLPTDGSQVMQWLDKSPTANTAIIDPFVTDTNSPILVTNSPLALREPGLGVVRFDGNSYLDVDFAASYTTANLVATPMTAFCVQVGNSGHMIGTEDSNPFNNNILHLGYKNVGSLVRYGQYGDDVEYPGTFDATTTRSWAWEMTSSTAATPYHQSIFLDGVEVANYPQRNRYFGESSAGVSVTVGQGHIGRGNNFNYTGDIAEVIIFNTDLSDTDRTNVWNYLNNKWRIGTVGGIATSSPFTVGTGGGGSSIQSVSVSGNQTTLTFSGIAGNSYTIQRSTNLVTGWIDLFTTNAPAGGTFHYIDTPNPTPKAFYRLKNN